VSCGGCILVVDDDPDIREALTDLLAELGCTAVTAVDGLDALQALERQPWPCLVLLDLNMPRMDGPTFARTVFERERALPIVSMSAGAGRLAPPLVREHLEKPFAAGALGPAISEHCRGCPRAKAATPPAASLA
jgi:CheY-like chemotaxis protein